LSPPAKEELLMVAAWKASAYVDISEEADGVVLRLCGELDLASCDAIEPAVGAAISSSDTVTLDLSQLTFCDSSGIAMLLRAHQQASVSGTRVSVCGVQPAIARVFEVSGIEELLPFRRI
jgi:anti-sigma B factor antagonist